MFIDELKSIVGPKGWIQDPAEMEPFVTEWRDRYRGRAQLVLAPETTAEVAAIVTVCAAHSIGIVPQGGNTGLCGGAIPDASGRQVVLLLRRMNRLRDVSPQDYSMVAEAGCTVSQIQNAAREVERFFPLSLASEGSCQVGGILSTNAGGINVLRYGTARRQVLGLEVVMPDGSVIDGLRSLRKDTAGYDLKHLFVGAEGTLGIITAACLRLQPAHANMNTVLLAIDSAPAAVSLLSAFQDALGETMIAFEVFSERALDFVLRHIPDTHNPFGESHPWFVIANCTAPDTEIENFLSSAIDQKLILNAVMAKSGSQSDSMWKLRHTISEAQKSEGVSLKHDVSVPVASVGVFIEKAEAAVLGFSPDARVVAFGHVGDGNVHFNISQPTHVAAADFLHEQEAIATIVYELVAELGGSFSAEHGVGQSRRDYLRRYRSGPEIAAMRAIKFAMDPNGIMNPGKVL